MTEHFANTPTTTDPLMTAADLATYLAKPLSWVYHNASLLPGYRIGRVLRFRRSDIELWLQDNRDGADSWHRRR